MDEDATDLMGAKFVHCSADILSALFDDAANIKLNPSSLEACSLFTIIWEGP
jgi:hypothetical protein